MRNVLNIFGGDKVIWLLILILTIYSGLAVSSSVASLAYRDGGNAAVHIIRHSSFLLVGWFVIYVTHLIPYKWYSVFSYLIILAAVLLLAYTLAKGAMINQAARWIKIQGAGVTFQSSEFAKLAMIIFIARYLSRNQSAIQNFKKGFVPVMLWIILVCGLILPANLSTALILFGTSLILLFIGRVRVQYLLGLVGVGIILLSMFLFLQSKLSNDQGRIRTWQSRIENYVSGNNEDVFQVQKAKIAIANGGMLGRFAGHSTQRASLPQAYSDFIFAIILEEYGFLFGALPLVFAYLILLYRAGVIVRKCDRAFPAFLVIGLTLGLVLQALINMGVSVGLLPVTGQTLPFISRGGTSILFTSIALGIILSISRSIEEKEITTNEK